MRHSSNLLCMVNLAVNRVLVFNKLFWLGILLASFSAMPLHGQSGVAPVANVSGNSTLPITYHGGPILPGPHDVYFIWYGNWTGNTALTILPELITGFNNSPYFNINSLYSDSAGASVDDVVSLSGQAFDSYSQGSSLTAVQVFDVVNRALVNGTLPYDSNGIYFVLTSPDVAQTSLPSGSGSFCEQSSQGYCGWHYFGSFEGRLGEVAFVGDPATQCPSTSAFRCSEQSVSPNSNEGADAMANVMAHELAETATDPGLNAWFDSAGNEVADKCNFEFGTTTLFNTPNGALANVTLRMRNFYIQQLWLNVGSGSCAMGFGDPFAPLNTASYYVSMHLADVNGDGKPDVCGRGEDGIYCALGNGDGTFGPVQFWGGGGGNFADSGGWGQPQYSNTIMFADINGDGKADVCGRGQSAIYCSLSNGSSFGPAFVALPNGFTDAQGWNQAAYYVSMRLADVNGDGKPDVCGRGQAGIYCALGNGDGTFGAVQFWGSGGGDFADSSGWGQPQYASSIMFADINGDGKADVCGRGQSAIYCSLSNGSGFDAAFVALPNGFTDAQGWDQQAYYVSMRLADVNGDGKPDVCGRGQAGIYCALGNGNGTFGAVQFWGSGGGDFADSSGWGQSRYATTIMFSDINGDHKADVCGRGQSAIYCSLSNGSGFAPAYGALSNGFTDAQGWDQ